ncbi:MAG: DUF4380 domain-containing protein [Terriglobia bacterium]
MRIKFVSSGAAVLLSLMAVGVTSVTAKPAPPACRFASVTLNGWKAELMSNEWVTLTFVPQLGGRLMQVMLGSHNYLFVNARLKGQYFPPSVEAAQNHWYNYGGDKIWPMPEGSKDEQHWAGAVGEPLDDSAFSLRILSHGSTCAVRLTGPADPQTGLQYSRVVSITNLSPGISFHAEMKNITGHPVHWSEQSVSQYNAGDTRDPSGFNHDFGAYAPASRDSVYLNGYHVRAGPAENPQYAVQNGMFTLRYMHVGGEVWVDSPGGWLAVVDGTTGYAMVERFHYQKDADYPGKATVIFYTTGQPYVSRHYPGAAGPPPPQPNPIYYMEAEVNSPVVELQPGKTFTMDTEWRPARTGQHFTTATYAGVVSAPLSATAEQAGVALSGSFGVFYAGELVAHLYDRDGMPAGVVRLEPADPLNLVTLRQMIPAPVSVARVSVHLVDPQGLDRGSLGEAQVSPAAGGSQ